MYCRPSDELDGSTLDCEKTNSGLWVLGVRAGFIDADQASVGDRSYAHLQSAETNGRFDQSCGRRIFALPRRHIIHRNTRWSAQDQTLPCPRMHYVKKDS